MNFVNYFNITGRTNAKNENKLAYTKADGIIALILWIFYMLVLWVNTIIYRQLKISDHIIGLPNSAFNDTLYILPYNILLFLILVIIIKMRKQKLKDIGFNKETSFKSFMLGLILIVPVLLYKFVFEGLFENKSFDEILWVILYYLSYIIVQEALFRGFIQPRVTALVKNKWVSIILVSVLFGLVSVPVSAALQGVNPFQLILSEFDVESMVLHIVLVYLYTRFNNILAPTAFSLAWNI